MPKGILLLFVIDWIPFYNGMTALPIFATDLMNFYNSLPFFLTKKNGNDDDMNTAYLTLSIFSVNRIFTMFGLWYINEYI